MEVMDVAIVGGGPAGSTAARVLAGEGFKVALLEKKELPRYKPCGGGITPKSFQFLGPSEEVFHRKVQKVSFAYMGDSYTVDYGKPVTYLVDRTEFDYSLVKDAEKSGAKIYAPCPVEEIREEEKEVILITSKGKIRARYLILADGINGRLGKGLKLGSNEHGVTIEAEISYPTEVLNRYFDRLVLDYGMIDRGYGWIFPKKDYLSIGIGSFQTKFPGIKERFNKFLQRYGLENGEILRLQGYPIPAGKTGHSLVSKRVLVAGDAAGLVDPVTGEGIYYALLSGKWAGETVSNAIARGTSLDDYQEKIAKNLWSEMEAAAGLSRFFYLCPGLFHYLFKKGPAVFKKIIDIMAGQNTYTDYFSGNFRDLFRLLKMLRKEDTGATG